VESRWRANKHGYAVMQEVAERTDGKVRMSPGTLYPILHGLEHKGYLRSVEQRDGPQVRRLYRATPAGRKALEVAKEKVRELFGELFEDD